MVDTEGHPEYLHQCAVRLAELDQNEEALVVIQKAIKVKDCPRFRETCANILMQMYRYRDVIDVVEAVDTASAQVIRGMGYTALKCYWQAEECYRKAVTLDPNDDKIKVELAFNQYRQYNWLSAFKLFEHRMGAFKTLNSIYHGLDPKKKWKGQKCKKLLLLWEQGIGDVFMFLRFVKFARSLAKEIVFYSVESPRTYIEAQNLFDAVHSARVPNHDYYLSILSLPAVLGLDHVPNSPYLGCKGVVDLDKTKYHIGVCHAGNPGFSGDYDRSCALQLFKPLSEIPNVKLWNLQVEKDQRVYDNKPQVYDLSKTDFEIDDPNIKTWDDTAIWINSLDLMVSVDTAIINLTGAMGKKGLALLPFYSCWRWGSGDTTPWYPTLQIIRQERQGDWSGLITTLSCYVSLVSKS